MPLFAAGLDPLGVDHIVVLAGDSGSAVSGDSSHPHSIKMGSPHRPRSLLPGTDRAPPWGPYMTRPACFSGMGGTLGGRCRQTTSVVVVVPVCGRVGPLVGCFHGPSGVTVIGAVVVCVGGPGKLAVARPGVVWYT